MYGDILPTSLRYDPFPVNNSSPVSKRTFRQCGTEAEPSAGKTADGLIKLMYQRMMLNIRCTDCAPARRRITYGPAGNVLNGRLVLCIPVTFHP